MTTSPALARLEDIARKAGAIAMNYFGRPVRAWDKAPGNPVSDADIAVNAFLYDALSGDGRHGWLSEESEDSPDRLACSSLWVVDPIDGTRAFLRGDTRFAISVALVENGRPRLGVIYRPATDDMYLAERGKGAYCNYRRLTVSRTGQLENCRMLADPDFLNASRHWPEPWPQLNCIEIPAIALRLAALAAGEADAMVSIRPKSDWDLAAGDLILREAGGICVDETGAKLVYNRARPNQPVVIATTPALQSPMIKRVAPAIRLYRARTSQK